MRGLGTIINVLAIILGGILGIACKKFVSLRYQYTIMKATGFSIIFFGAAGAFSRMLSISDVTNTLEVSGTIIMILSLTFGSLLGEMLDIDRRFEQFGSWLKQKTGSENDNEFTNAFVSASLTVSIGAMAILGAIQDGVYGDYTILASKAILDFIIILIMSASMGKGCIFSFIPVAFLQGGITALAVMLSEIMTETLLNNLSLVGNILIFCVGINLIWPNTVKVANLLPAIIIAVAFAFI